MFAAELVPPVTEINHDRPRLLLRAKDTPYAISLQQLRVLPRDAEFQKMLQQLESLKPPRVAVLALAYHLTGRADTAERALAVMRAWQMPQNKETLNDPLNVYFTLLDMALAYDWLHGYAGFDDQSRTALRQKLWPFAENAFKLGDDHVFHNYVWMYNGGAMQRARMVMEDRVVAPGQRQIGLWTISFPAQFQECQSRTEETASAPPVDVKRLMS